MNMRLISLPVAMALLLSGCNLLRTDKSYYAGTPEMLARGDYPSAIAQIEAARNKAYTTKDRVVFYLDLGMLYHWNGDYQKSNEYLEMAERAIEENFTQRIASAAASILLNDNVLAYAGEDYEDIYLNLFKSLNYLALNQNDEAFVEVRRIDNKLAVLGDKYNKLAEELNTAEEAQKPFHVGKSCFTESAIGRYLSALFYRQENKWDDLRIDFDKIDRAWRGQPSIHPWTKPDLAAEQQRTANPSARLNIIAFSGLSPDKIANTFYVHTEKDTVVLAGSSEDYLGKQRLDGIDVMPWIGMEAGYHFKFQLPSMERIPSRVHHITVSIEGESVQPLQPIESMENAAVEAFSIKKPIIYLKTLTRAVLKGIASEQAKAKMTKDMGEGLAFLTRFATDAVVDQTENADLRVSRFFPAEAAIREIQLEPGTYIIRINYHDFDGAVLYADERAGVQVEANRLNVLESAYLN